MATEDSFSEPIDILSGIFRELVDKLISIQYDVSKAIL
jgi:hypothetical protein